ncbi:hypothetical protein DW074_01355 [Ruminococcus sp. AF46-10NS]|nr:hypothetical protein DW074_01355 [Ruminococcus sp. AF46-10NS]
MFFLLLLSFSYIFTSGDIPFPSCFITALHSLSSKAILTILAHRKIPCNAETAKFAFVQISAFAFLRYAQEVSPASQA